MLTQVNLSYQEYLTSLEDYDNSRQVDEVQQQIRVASKNISAANAQSEADRVRRELASMVSELAYDRSVSQVHTALVNLYTAVGVDLVSPTVQTDDLATLSQHVASAIAGWEAGELPKTDIPVALQGDIGNKAAVPVAVASTGGPVRKAE